jgi:hypothetical protein
LLRTQFLRCIAQANTTFERKQRDEVFDRAMGYLRRARELEGVGRSATDHAPPASSALGDRGAKR